MTKRIIGLVLALCLVVGLLPMIALAGETEAPTATLVITTGNADAKVQWKPTLSAGMATAYAKTTAEGALVLEGASESDYNLKVEWAAEGKPTLTLKDATLTNDNYYPNKIDTIAIGGTADFIIKIAGTNVINGNPANTSTTSAAYRCAIGITASNKGTLTIQGANKWNDTLTIDNKGGNGIVKKYNALTIDKCAVTIKCVNTSSNGQHGIILTYEDAGREDLCNLTVTNAKLDITAGKYHANCAIMVSKTESTTTGNVNANTGDILFKDSVIRLYRSNGSGSTQVTSSLVALGSGSTFTIDNCAVTIYSRHVIARYAPTLVNMQGATYTPEDGTTADWTYEAGAYIGTTKISSFTATHNCTTAAADDFDCTTPAACEICGAAMGTAMNAHTPGADDGDCSTPVMCTNPGCQQPAVAAGAHTPETDDGDCSTAVKCAVCGGEAIAAKTHTYTDAADAGCDNDGCEYTRVILTSSLTITTGTNDAKVQWKPTLTEGMEPAYAKTTAEGALVLDGASASDYNLKVEWPVGGKPTLTLNGATIANDTNNIGSSSVMSHTIYIGGTAAFEIVLKGTNTINGTQGIDDTTVANHRMPAGIYSENKAALTIKSADKAVDTLLIDNNGGNGIYKAYSALNIENATVTINMRTTATNGQNGIVMAYTSAGYEDKTDLTVIGSTLAVTNTGKYFGNNMLILGKTGKYDATNTSDVLFKNSTITFARNSSSSVNSGDAEAVRVGPNGSVTFDRCDFNITGNHRTFKYVPTFINCKNVQTKTSWSDWTDLTLAAGTALTANTNNSGYKGTHVCGSASDDGDCTTATVCDMCGQTVAAQTAHTGTDDGDCTTAVMCSNPGCQKVAVPAAAAHTPEADDGDCTTAIKCSVCGTETTAGAASHIGGTATCKDKAKCTTCGKEYGELLTTHVPNADDGDCTTAITCSICGTETTPAKAAHTGGTATCKDKAKCTECGKEYGEKLTTHTPGERTDCTVDTMCTVCGEVAIAAGSHTGGTATCKDKAKCTTCGKEYGELSTTHVPNADDGDCTTAITCSICGTETTAAATAHTGGTATCKDKAKCATCGKEYGELLTTHVPNADDGDCTTAITCSICGTETTAAAAAHTGGTATCKDKAKCTTCGKEYGELKAHTPAADDGDCTTAIVCSACGTETTAAATHTGGTATCKAKAKCATCGKEYGELAAHTPAADDGDCTTAIKCSVCDAETTAAKSAHTYTDDKDTACDNAGCTKTRTVSSNPQTGDSANLPLLFTLLLISAAGILVLGGVFIFTKLRKKAN